jgi:L-Ala-D/L-Glu epimerase
MAGVERITVHRFKVPLDTPYRQAFDPVERFGIVVVECAGRDGRIGLSDATVLTGYTEETMKKFAIKK